MTRELLPYFNSSYGDGLEGTVNYINEIGGNFTIPLFLIALYGISIYVFSKSEYNLGGGLFFISFIFFLMAIILQIVTTFNFLFIFIFFIGMIVGIILYFTEGN
jgi:hypothetical protein